MIKKIIKILLPHFIKSYILNIIWNTNGKYFCNFYNLCASLLYKNKNFVVYDGAKYILKEEGFKWSFRYERRGLWYLNGIKERAKKLHKDYGIENIKFSNNDVIIDVGADVGDFKNGFDCEVDYYAYEADPGLYEVLKFNCNEKNCYNFGVWENDSKEINFYINKNKKKSITKVPGETEEIKIKTLTLDSIIERINKKIKLIKIDTTGSEPEVLKGLSKYLMNVDYVVVDAGTERGLNKDHTIIECLNYLYEKNFKVVNFKKRRSSILFQNK